eukprot:EG_transcript_25753
MGNLFNCVQEEVPYELAVTAVDLSGVGEGAPDIQLTISLGDKSETTPKGQLQDGKYVWNYPQDDPWIFSGKVLGKDTLAIKLSGIDKELPEVPLSGFTLEKGKASRVTLPVDDDLQLTVEITLVVVEVKAAPDAEPAAAELSAATAADGAAPPEVKLESPPSEAQATS